VNKLGKRFISIGWGNFSSRGEVLLVHS